MKQKNVFQTHYTALSVLLVMGSGVITLPRSGADEYTFLAFILSAVAAVCLNFAAIPLVNFILKEGSGKMSALKSAFSVTVYSALSIAVLWLIKAGFEELAVFLKNALLGKTPISLIYILLAAVTLYFCMNRQESILKLALLSFWADLVLVAIFFIMAMPNYNLRNIFIFRLPDFKTLLDQMKPYFTAAVLPSLLVPIYGGLIFKKSSPSAAFNVGLGFVLLGATVLCPLLLFGAPFSGETDFPFLSAASTVTVGRLFTRLTGFAYFICFSTAIIKLTAGIFIIKSLLNRINAILR